MTKKPILTKQTIDKIKKVLVVLNLIIAAEEIISNIVEIVKLFR